MTAIATATTSRRSVGFTTSSTSSISANSLTSPTSFKDTTMTTTLTNSTTHSHGGMMPAHPITTSTVQPQRLSRLFKVELRKTVDTRAGRMMIASVMLLALGIATWGALRHWGGTEPLTFKDFVEAVTMPVSLLLPVVGVLAMTSEWSQRTALTTFTLSPRRTRVLLCKVGSALLLSVAVTAAAIAVTFAAVPVAASVSGVHASYAGIGASISSIFIAVALSTLMGAAFGALLSITPAALVAYYAAPLIWSQVGSALFKSEAKWLDVSGAIQNISTRKLTGIWPQTLTSITVWIVIPLIAGLIVSSRREVK